MKLITFKKKTKNKMEEQESVERENIKVKRKAKKS
jgi:hypothetical protein